MEKRSKIIVIIGVVLLIAAPILGFLVDKITLFSLTPVPIQEDSSNGIQKSFAFPTSLAKNQKMVIEFSVYYANVSATLKILGKGTYDSAYATNSSPTGISGLNFVYSEFTYGQSPSSSTVAANSRTINEDGFWYVEFAGTTSGDYIVSRPGDYVVIVYGTNSGSSNQVLFNINIKVDGPGEFFQNLFLAVGIIILVCYVLFFSYGYLNKLRRGIE